MLLAGLRCVCSEIFRFKSCAKCSFRMSQKECLTRVIKSVSQESLQKCPTRGSHKNVPQECPTRVPRKSPLQQRPTRVSHKRALKSDPQECTTKMSHKSALQDIYKGAGCQAKVLNNIWQICVWTSADVWNIRVHAALFGMGLWKLVPGGRCLRRGRGECSPGMASWLC